MEARSKLGLRHDLLVSQDDRSSFLQIGQRCMRFVKKYADISGEILRALQAYREDVTGGGFPGQEHSFTIHDGEFKKIPPRGAGRAL